MLLGHKKGLLRCLSSGRQLWCESTQRYLTTCGRYLGCPLTLTQTVWSLVHHWVFRNWCVQSVPFHREVFVIYFEVLVYMASYANCTVFAASLVHYLCALELCVGHTMSCDGMPFDCTPCDAMPGMDVDKVDVTVVGGHAGTTIMPLLSQVLGRLFPVNRCYRVCVIFHAIDACVLHGRSRPQCLLALLLCADISPSM